MRGWKKDISCKWKQESEGNNTHIRQNFKGYNKRQGHDNMIKGSIQEEIILVNIYAPNTGASKYIKQILTNKRRNWQ